MVSTLTGSTGFKFLGDSISPGVLLLHVGHVLVVGAAAGRLLDVGGGVLVLDVDRARVAHADRVASLHITPML